MKTQLLLPALTALALAPTAFAQVVNGDFSSSLSGWSASGDASVRNGAGFVTTASFAEDDDGLGSGFFNFSGNETTFAADMETALGLSTDSLSPDTGGGVFAYEGSAIFQSITVQAGEVLSFNWTFLTNEDGGSDYAFLVIDGSIFNLSTGASLSPVSTYDYDFTTSGQSYQSAAFGGAATITVGFGVVDVDNFAGSSALIVDNVSVAAIPEPSAFAALAGFAALGLVALRRRTRAA
jgi:hypothetical protein